ncbi:RNA polymerase sigma-70 factor [Marixanthomonas spongiae]|uniref:RNA polymerase sigma-70 factor n=1 Tax=Marixanthomonas spongiae TaxID=2174845 RepID=A0A2U0HUV4_9FLAO|nr:RNA polymerase sigma-70 factor [Marixanthomonas spongiae]PVW12616.1 RNA polymerase sigma-70 factor [Marixanthomonas spongiae]
MLKSYSNNELLERIAVNDTKAFEEIYQRHATKMLVYATNILNNQMVCEDLVQNVFIDLWKKRNTKKITNLEAYLFRAVKFQVFNYFRNNKLRDTDLTRLNIVDLSINASKKMEFEELEATIQTLVQKLPPRCQEIFVLSRFEHKSNKEIASELEISEQAVKNQVSKALIFLRENLQKDEYLPIFSLFFGLLAQ